MSTGVVSLGLDITIAILLHKTAVTHIVNIGAFKAITILIFFDSWAISLAILILAFEL